MDPRERVQGSTFRGIVWRSEAHKASVALNSPQCTPWASPVRSAHSRSDLFWNCVTSPGNEPWNTWRCLTLPEHLPESGSLGSLGSLDRPTWPAIQLSAPAGRAWRPLRPQSTAWASESPTRGLETQARAPARAIRATADSPAVGYQSPKARNPAPCHYSRRATSSTSSCARAVLGLRKREVLSGW